MKRFLLCLIAMVFWIQIRAGAQEPLQPAPAPDKAELLKALDGSDGRELLLRNFKPVPMLKVEEHALPHARFPTVDVHMHPRIRLHSSPVQLAEYVRLMDVHHIAVSVSLDGGLGERLLEHKAFLNKHPDRFVFFANIDWQGTGQAADFASWDCQRPDFARRMALALTQARKDGAVGLKIFKDFGLSYRNADGSYIRVNDSRWDPIWDACGALNMPVLIHTGDPAAFFLPTDNRNERWEELQRHPDWAFNKPGMPTRKQLMDDLLDVVGKHEKTTFIGAHVASNAEDLTQTAHWLDEHPNLYVDSAARIGELGRQPRAAKKFIERYQDRVLFGTDGPRVHERLLYHWRFFETEDEYFPYAEGDFPPQGFWRIYGLGLSDDLLHKFYHANVERLIPTIGEQRARVIERLHWDDPKSRKDSQPTDSPRPAE